ncbi:MAG TPA: hypothetical protein VOB72_04380 [Candidatus Dormibacteraeota bacterium]|nr:hypothetical protein [Candidatus Dormibacteraeota bacterium]
MAPAGFNVQTGDLTTLAGGFANEVPALARDVQSVVAGLTVDTGDAALDARISTLAGQIAASLAGAGQALQADSTGLVSNAATYTGADFGSVPTLPLP